MKIIGQLMIEFSNISKHNPSFNSISLNIKSGSSEFSKYSIDSSTPERILTTLYSEEYSSIYFSLIEQYLGRLLLQLRSCLFMVRVLTKEALH